MPISKNYVSLIGFLGSKPELNKTKTSKTPVTSFSMAMNEVYEDRRGKEVERTTWVKVRVWDRKAKAVCEYLDKGSLVEVEGKIVDAEAWEDEDGNLHAASVVEARYVRFLDRAQRDEEDERPARRTSRRSTTRRRRDEDDEQTTTRRSVRRSTRRQRDEDEDEDEDRVSEMLADLSPRERRELLRNLGKDNGSTRRRRSSSYVEDTDDDDEPVEELSARQSRRDKKVPFAKAR